MFTSAPPRCGFPGMGRGTGAGSAIFRSTGNSLGVVGVSDLAASGEGSGGHRGPAVGIGDCCEGCY